MTSRRTSRRTFLTGVTASAALAGTACSVPGPRKVVRPNILFIMTDQQSATMLSAAGNQWLKTPAMDGLAETGVRFEKSYCTAPVCVPSRFSLMTGLYPSAVGVRHNGSKATEKMASMPQRAMGHLIRAGGYETVYGGKVHLPKPIGNNIAPCGFDVLTGDQRGELAEACVSYLRKSHEKPFVMFASFINPHDICYMAIRDYSNSKPRKAPPAIDWALQLPDGVSEEEFYAKHCPPIPANFEIPSEEPEAITWLTKLRPFRQNARDNWSEERWRMHRWAYCRLTERVDAQIGLVLNALRETGLEENTLVIFTSDHGDMDSAHRMEHKTVFYEEAARIPLLVRAPGQSGAGMVDRTNLVSNGLDVLPTICDYAGVEAPAGLQGTSLRPLLEGQPPAAWRNTLFIEDEIGYMVTDGRYKYSAYDPDKGARREYLVDLETDPGEMRNLAGSPEHHDAVTRLRAAMADWQRQNGIQFEMPA